MATSLLISASCAGIFLTQTRLDAIIPPREAVVREMMYFPSGRFMSALTVGFDNLAADLVWLRAVQYYGQHRLTDLKFEYLGHILDILTTLDSKFVSAYTFGALLLTDDAKEPERALKLLDKGMRSNPRDWRVPFTKGFIYYVFLRDYFKAGKYFEMASLKEDAPDMTARFASFSFQKGGDRITAINLWSELYARSGNEIERQTALRYSKNLLSEILDEKVTLYREIHGGHPEQLSDLVESGLVRRLPLAPDGEGFVFNREGLRVEPVSGPVRGLD